ncbi:MAG: hypothetical protein Q9182_007438 [Xanthomendoza sp. 2 TL-2023]
MEGNLIHTTDEQILADSDAMPDETFRDHHKAVVLNVLTDPGWEFLQEMSSDSYTDHQKQLLEQWCDHVIGPPSMPPSAGRRISQSAARPQSTGVGSPATNSREIWQKQVIEKLQGPLELDEPTKEALASYTPLDSLKDRLQAETLSEHLPSQGSAANEIQEAFASSPIREELAESGVDRLGRDLQSYLLSDFVGNTMDKVLGLIAAQESERA